jgi:anti-sigma B factor antagonist
MSITHNQDGVFTVVSMNGRFDALGARDFKNVISLLLDAQKKRIVLDMAHVDFIDSSGMGALVGVLRTVVKEGGEIRIAGLIPEVHTIFELTRLHRLFDIYETATAATLEITNE